MVCLDIIGYKAIIEEANSSGSPEPRVSDLRWVIDFARDRVEHSKRWSQKAWPPTNDAELIDRIRQQVLSDTIVLTCPVTKEGDGCFYALLFATTLVNALASKDFWIRGAITRGPHYHDDERGIVFSPAFVEAYMMGENEAFYPRVLVAEKVSKDAEQVRLVDTGQEGEDVLKQRRTFAQKAILIDRDGRCFLNYLSSIDADNLLHWDEAPETYRWCDAEHIALSRHAELIGRHLQEHAGNPRIAAKYGWLADYHNRFCEALPKDLPDKYRIPFGFQGGRSGAGDSPSPSSPS